jgi:hypothetical protein
VVTLILVLEGIILQAGSCQVTGGHQLAGDCSIVVCPYQVVSLVVVDHLDKISIVYLCISKKENNYDIVEFMHP